MFPLYIRISYTASMVTDGTGKYAVAINLTTCLQGSNDWASCKGLYANYTVKKCLVQYLPGWTPINGVLTGSSRAFGMAYDHTNSTALVAFNQVADYENYQFALPGSIAHARVNLKFKIRPIAPGPWNTNDNTNYIGWLKTFLDSSVELENSTFGTLVFQFYCQFGGVQ